MAVHGETRKDQEAASRFAGLMPRAWFVDARYTYAVLSGGADITLFVCSQMQWISCFSGKFWALGCFEPSAEGSSFPGTALGGCNLGV